MWRYDNIIERLVRKIEKFEKNKIKLCEILRAMLSKEISNTVLSGLDQVVFEENRLINKVPEISIDGLSIAGIDGGLLLKRLNGLDLIILRATGVVFKYMKHTVDAIYHPKKDPPLQISINTIPLSSIEFDTLVSFERSKIELKTTYEVIKKYTPDIVLLDGSLISPSLQIITNNDLIRKKYSEMIYEYQRVYDAAENRGILIAGVIKDSKKHIFIDILGRIIPQIIALNREFIDELVKIDYRIVLRHSNDLDLLFSLLECGERTAFIKEKTNKSSVNSINQNTIQKDIQEFYSFYLKAAKFDVPMRIEFFDIEKNPILIGNKIATIIYNISKFSTTMGFPSVLIEADRRVKMIKKDIDFIYRQFLTRANIMNSKLLPQRREKQIL